MSETFRRLFVAALLTAMISGAGAETPSGAGAETLSRAGAASDLGSPVGLWRTIDDHSGKPRGLVRVYLENGAYFGKIEKNFDADAEGKLCIACKDDRKGQPVVGLVIMRNVKLDDGDYGDGDILDPDSGTVYDCKFHLDQGGQALVVRGFLGISLLGRSQTWIREE